MTELKMDPELLARLRLLARDPDQARRLAAVERFGRTESVVALMAGMDEEQAEAFYQRMLSDAAPGTEEIVARFIDRIRTARAQRPS
jgi:hypothetical protein